MSEQSAGRRVRRWSPQGARAAAGCGVGRPVTRAARRVWRGPLPGVVLAAAGWRWLLPGVVLAAAGCGAGAVAGVVIRYDR